MPVPPVVFPLPTTAFPMRTLSLALLIAGLAASLAACDAAGPDAQQARLTVRLTDAPFPFDLAESANVTITRIELLANEDDDEDSAAAEATAAEASVDRIVLYDGAPVALNLLDLRDGVDTLLVNGATIPADGSYNRLRFYVGEDAHVVFSDGSRYALKLPSAQQSGIKVTLPDYEVGEADGEIDVLIDFNVEESFVTRGNPGSQDFQGFLFKPVLKVKNFQVVPADDAAEGDGSEGDGSEG